MTGGQWPAVGGVQSGDTGHHLIAMRQMPGHMPWHFLN